MLQRLDVLLHRQHFCDSGAPVWPPASAISIEVTQFNQSCKQACQRKGMLLSFSATCLQVTRCVVKCRDLLYTDVLHTSGRICEPVHFPRLNTAEALENYIQKADITPNKKICLEVVKNPDIYYPAYEPASLKCILQDQSMLYSCVGNSDQLRRICPCRDFIPGQTALCSSCL